MSTPWAWINAVSLLNNEGDFHAYAAELPDTLPPSRSYHPHRRAPTTSPTVAWMQARELLGASMVDWTPYRLVTDDEVKTKDAAALGSRAQFECRTCRPTHVMGTGMYPDEVLEDHPEAL